MFSLLLRIPFILKEFNREEDGRGKQERERQGQEDMDWKVGREKDGFV